MTARARRRRRTGFTMAVGLGRRSNAPRWLQCTEYSCVAVLMRGSHSADGCGMLAQLSQSLEIVIVPIGAALNHRRAVVVI